LITQKTYLAAVPGEKRIGQSTPITSAKDLSTLCEPTKTAADPQKHVSRSSKNGQVIFDWVKKH
jgi:hypothetical protein